MQKFKNNMSDGWLFTQELRFFRNFMRNWDRDVNDSDFFDIFANSNNSSSVETQALLKRHFPLETLAKCEGISTEREHRSLRRGRNDADEPKDRRGFFFVNGLLRKRLVGEREATVRVPPPGNDPEALAALWPDKGTRLVAAEPPDIWSDGSRLRMWFDNPNKAGLFFAELALVFLAFMFCSPIWLRVCGAVLSLASFACLVQTSSRGALLSFLCGLIAMGLVRLKSLLTVRRLLLVAVAVGVAVGCLFAAGQGERLAKNLFNEGQRETSRLTVWKQVPRMMVDAPDGWGLGQAARAYIDWYQPKSSCLLKNLISGHLTFMVETGWPIRFGYVFLWLAAGLVSAWLSLRGASPVPLALIVAFAVAGCFNPVIDVPELWGVPVGAVLALAVARFRVWCARGVVVPISIAGLGAAIAIGGVYAWGMTASQEMAIRKDGRAICLNGTDPKIWIVDDDYSLHGGYWWLAGRELRDALAQKEPSTAIGYVRSVADVPSDAEKIVLVGETGHDFLALADKPRAKSIVFLSPSFPWQAVPKDLMTSYDVSLVVGGLVARLAAGKDSLPSWVTVVPGTEIYIPNWLNFVL